MNGLLKVFMSPSRVLTRQLQGPCLRPYADLIWCETAVPDLDEARQYAEAIRRDIRISYWPTTVPPLSTGKRIWRCSKIKVPAELGAMGYKYQFITLAGIHSMWYPMFDLTANYVRDGMRLSGNGPGKGICGSGSGLYICQSPG
ncbi:MAG: hypothetical protein Ct9H300mP14_05040 [Gammaproteobacteria bacterium]|nr:MAG: hypothetical protein Ct9H300mP14_05040 [Gammaproteobacteria bacterium]